MYVAQGVVVIFILHRENYVKWKKVHVQSETPSHNLHSLIYKSSTRITCADFVFWPLRAAEGDTERVLSAATIFHSLNVKLCPWSPSWLPAHCVNVCLHSNITAEIEFCSFSPVSCPLTLATLHLSPQLTVLVRHLVFPPNITMPTKVHLMLLHVTPDMVHAFLQIMSYRG